MKLQPPSQTTIATGKKHPGDVLDQGSGRLAFTLLEVMIALAIFFMAMFAILSLVSNTLRNAHALQEIEVDAGSLVAEVIRTNRLSEGSYSGDFGDAYPDYTWDRTDTPITNGLWQCDFEVHHHAGRHRVDTSMRILQFKPDSPGTMGGPQFAPGQGMGNPAGGGGIRR